ncbi:MAG TPA: DinB family protein, partial [Puia sp.]|nr:DinB family protein [Puia sp.]
MEKAPDELFAATVLSNWELAIKRINALFDRHTDADLLKPIAPGKNRVIYLLGHLVAIHDNMVPLLGLGDKRYPDLDAPFIHNPDNPETKLPSAATLRQQWKEI